MKFSYCDLSQKNLQRGFFLSIHRWNVEKLSLFDLALFSFVAIVSPRKQKNDGEKSAKNIARSKCQRHRLG